MEVSEQNLIWSAIDAPRLEPHDWDLFWSKWNEYAGSSYINKQDPMGNKDSQYQSTGKRTEFFKGINIYAKDPKALEEGHWVLPFLSYEDIWPEILDDIKRLCPWVGDVLFLRLWNSTMDIPFHKDHTLEDVTLRAMIYDENNKPTFKVLKPGKGTHYVNLPPETNWFVYNNTTCLHGSDKVSGVNKIILLIVHRTKNKEMLLEHLRSSAERYPEHHRYA